jgi:hypothetical protein
MVVPEELVPLFVRTTMTTAMQILAEGHQKVVSLRASVPDAEEELILTLEERLKIIELAHMTLLREIYNHPEEPMRLLVPEMDLVGPNGERLRKGPEA